MLLFYFFPIFDIGFLLLAVPSRSSTVMKEECKRQTSLVKMFRESTFYTSALLISAFIVLVIIPDLVILFAPIHPMTPHLRLVCALLPRELSFVVDATIYMLTMKKVKRRIRRILCRPWCCRGTVDVFPVSERTSRRTVTFVV